MDSSGARLRSARPGLMNCAGCRRYDRATILRWMRVFFQRFFSQQFKRSAMPDGPKVGIISLSPRGDWRMPSDATATLWLREIDLLIQEK